MLKGVVSDVGTAAAAEIPGYTVAGKTGTAQKPGPNGYMPGKYVASFVGMVPASNPRLVVLVTVDEPTLAIFGGVVAAPAFAQIARSTSSTSKFRRISRSSSPRAGSGRGRG